MRKIFKKKKYKIFESIANNNLGSIARTLLSSVVVVFIFYSLPLIINFASDNFLNTKEFRNNSKTVLVYTLDKKTNGSLDDDENFDEVADKYVETFPSSL